jgi:N-acetyl-anhydromuramyl-L-alanine amidase AmpD
MDFVQARWFTRVTTKRRIDFLVLHDMEWPERPTTAEDCARFFATTDIKASAHYNVDVDSIVQSVRENDIAYHAPPNTHSIGVEHAGYARQSRAQWLDDYGQKMLRLSAGLVAELLVKYDLPAVFLSPADLRAGKRGITTHANVSKAWGQTTHTDPGPDFPIDWYMARVREALEGDDMPLSDADVEKVAKRTAEIILDDRMAALVDRVRRGVQGEVGDENVGELSDRIVSKLLERLPGLGPGVDHARGDLAVFRPTRDQTPVERLHARDAVGSGNDGVDVVGGRDVVVVAERLDLGVRVEVLGDLVRLARGDESSAHRQRSDRGRVNAHRR